MLKGWKGNAARDRDEALQVHERIASVARQFLKTDVAFSGYVVSDDAVKLAVRKRVPFVRVRDLESLADDVLVQC